MSTPGDHREDPQDREKTAMAPESPSYVAENAEVARGFKNAPIAGALFAANIGVFAAQIFLAGDWRYIAGIPDPILRWLGANASLWTIADNRFETLVTACFLHGSVLHLGVNMFLLWQVGPLLERAIGSVRFFPLYLAGGIVGAAASAIWGRFFGQTLSVGASGALCGLVAAAMVVGIRTEGWKSELTVHMARWLGIIILIGLVRTLRPDISQIDNAAHIGGAFAGAVIAIAWERGYAYSKRAEHAVLAGCVALVLASSAVVYTRNKTDPYVFLDVEGRLRVAFTAASSGQCDRAWEAVQRAVQMDPTNPNVRDAALDIDRRCIATTPGPRSKH